MLAAQEVAGAVELQHVLIFAGRVAGFSFECEAEARVADTKFASECFELSAIGEVRQHLGLGLHDEFGIGVVRDFVGL